MSVVLGFKILVREGGAQGGVSRVPRRSVDFTIDGVSLLSMLVAASGGHDDLMGILVEGAPELSATGLSELLGTAPPELLSGRTRLYVCPECGDIGCGAYAARVLATPGGYEWSDFAFENGYESPTSLPQIGPFQFDREQYEQEMSRASVA